MNTFKKKSLNAALAGLTVVGAVGAAQAVNVNPDGLGQVLLYPYYTTRADKAGNTYSTLISVVNSTQTTKAVKVRFIEGKNSRKFSTSTCSCRRMTSGPTSFPTPPPAARIVTDDTSCTLPKLPSRDRRGADARRRTRQLRAHGPTRQRRHQLIAPAKAMSKSSRWRRTSRARRRTTKRCTIRPPARRIAAPR
jgi:hypothetical protein